MRVLITTTINVPRNLRDWRASGFNDHDVFIVAGDLKTPHVAVEQFLRTLPGDNRYLHPDGQRGWASSEVLGWNCIQRRNIALLEALRLKPEWIITVDDDNYPIDPDHALYLEDIFSGLNADYLTVSGMEGWWNVGEMLTPAVVHRGYPLSRRPVEERALHYHRNQSIGVVASLWLGDPDIDAPQRMTHRYAIESMATEQSRVLESGTWCPFNSQATAWITELAPLMAVWPGVGRYDDIFASYLARAVMDATRYRVLYGQPLVRQTRNAHNVLNDLRNEFFGFEHTDALCDKLRELPEGDIADAFTWLIEDPAFSFLPEQTRQFFSAWLEDLGHVMPDNA